MAVAQIAEGEAFADRGVELECDATVLKPLDAAFDDVFLQLETWNAIDQKPAAAVIAVIDGDLIALAAKLFSCSEPAGTRTDDAGRFLALARRLDGRDPAFFPGIIGDEPLDGTDRHRAMAGLFNRADAFAETVLRADPATHLGHVVGRRR